MIGYNVDKIEELASKVANSYKTIGEKMSEGWGSLSRTMENEWIGPDEVSYEQELAKNICSLYASCQQTVSDMLTNIKILGNNWKSFQMSNSLEGASISSSGVFSRELEIPNISNYTYDIASIVKSGNPQFTDSTNLGLKSGVQSGSLIKTEFDAYIESVYNSVKSLYTDLDTGSAFLGTTLSTSVKSYLETMAESLAKLTTCHRSIYEALDQLINRYATHEEDESSSINMQSYRSIDYQQQNLK